MANADCIVIQGSNMAECHPVAFQWVVEARRRGARVIHVDPRFTRTTANADKHVPIRTGSDIVLLGALINAVIAGGHWFDEYVRHYTNAANLISADYVDPEDLEGLFSGFDPQTNRYDNSSWQYELDERGEPVTDPSLEHPRCVFQILKRHFARYTPERVEELCGISRADFDYLLSSIVENSGRERTTCFTYAVGWTQHTLGSQFIRTAAILQLLLGNMGRTGGGIMALRGHANIQGSTDIPTLFHLLPGYLPTPNAERHPTLEAYVRDVGTPETQRGFWSNAEAYTVSLLKAWYGEYAQPQNSFAFDRLPRLNGPLGTYQTLLKMLNDEVDGYFILGQNPAVGSANGRMQRMGMSHLKWLVVRDFALIESATWWKDGPEIESGELTPEEIETEVFFLPAANHTEKAGSFTQTQRLVQWRQKAVDPPGDCQSELDFFYELGVRIRQRLADSDDPRDELLLNMTWDYPVDEHGEVDPEAVTREINGFHINSDGTPGPAVNSFGELKADGSTASGCWIYAGVYAGDVNQAARKKPGREQDEAALEWGWAWPANRRILYNRASADPQGKPWSERKKHVWWDEEQGRWVGLDVPDFPPDRAPSAVGESAYGGTAALRGDDPFLMQPDGKGWLFAPTGMVDGPLPTHYEPQGSTVRNPLYPQQNNPSRVTLGRDDNLSGPGALAPGGDVYPYVFTTYRLTEHHTAGGMSRWLPYLSELQPELFCEISPELAAEVGVEPYGWATLVSPSQAIEVRVLVTQRMTPLTIAGKTIHHIGLPYHWAQGGEGAYITGDSVNDLLGITMEPNTFIQNSKHGVAAMLPGRRPRGPERLDLVEKYQREAGLTVESGNEHLTVSDAARDGSQAEGSTGAPGAFGSTGGGERADGGAAADAGAGGAAGQAGGPAGAAGENAGSGAESACGVPGQSGDCGCAPIPEGADFKRAGRAKAASGSDEACASDEGPQTADDTREEGER